MAVTVKGHSVTEGNRMPFERGKPKTGGRLPGVSNKLTGAFRDAVRHVYTGLGGHANFLAWAKDNQTEFYRIASRLIPGEMQEGNGAGNITVVLCGPQSEPARDRQPVLLEGTGVGPDM
jgi:hypothetical protein